jgi:hypothetical protein
MASPLPDYDSKKNGLEQLTKALVDNPSNPIIAIVVLDSSITTIDHTKKTRTPTVRITHIEPMITAGTQEEARDLLERCYRARTSEQLELDLGFDAPRPDGVRPTGGGLRNFPTEATGVDKMDEMVRGFGQ